MKILWLHEEVITKSLGILWEIREELLALIVTCGCPNSHLHHFLLLMQIKMLESSNSFVRVSISIGNDLISILFTDHNRGDMNVRACTVVFDDCSFKIIWGNIIEEDSQVSTCFLGMSSLHCVGTLPSPHSNDKTLLRSMFLLRCILEWNTTFNVFWIDMKLTHDWVTIRNMSVVCDIKIKLTWIVTLYAYHHSQEN